MKLRDKTIPEIQEEIKHETANIAMFAKSIALPQNLMINHQIKQIGDLNEKILQVELYGGIHENIHIIQEGKSGKESDKIHIYQGIRYMDEECLYNYQLGGIKITQIDDFDDWIKKPHNLNRLMPHPKCILGIQVRRHDFKNSRISSISDAIYENEMRQADKSTFLYIRNGDNVYRLSTAAEFKQLIPKQGEFTIDSTPKDFQYDDKLEAIQEKSNAFNKIYVILQGLLDRSTILQPIPPFKVYKKEVLEYITNVYDLEGIEREENFSWDNTYSQAYKHIKKGDTVICTYNLPIITNHSDTTYQHKHEVTTVLRVSRDKKYVYTSYGGEYSNEVTGKVYPIKEYKLGDYLKFVDSSKEKSLYTNWAPFLLEAEKIKRTKLLKELDTHLSKKTTISNSDLKSIIKNATNNGKIAIEVVTDYLVDVMKYTYEHKTYTRKPYLNNKRYIVLNTEKTKIETNDDINTTYWETKPHIPISSDIVILDQLHKNTTYSYWSKVKQFISNKETKVKSSNTKIEYDTFLKYIT